ncbi:DUF6944 family repetitive protein [Pseudalkalibacillus sp. Hm43]|uniref:DUF6944 family repetitive protein n=1 Tax=Pseudalkalibacillus sp. Hm43 TaxID=3450742 RepID=UPI003F43BA0E
MFPKLLEVAGVWIQALGTFINASGQTVIVLEKDENNVEGNSLALIGNGVEAFGNSLQAIGKTNTEPENSDGILGAWLQSAGNITNSYAAYQIIRGFEIEGLFLDLFGDSIQSIGAFLESLSHLEGELIEAELASRGQLLQSFGGILEAIGVLYILKDNMAEGIQIQAFGSYAQTAGATLTAIAITKDFLSTEST